MAYAIRTWNFRLEEEGDYRSFSGGLVVYQNSHVSLIRLGLRVSVVCHATSYRV